ncbi:NAD kinase 2, mitochondrial-like isoform X2 [Aquila chrysaetos chrysaetos]|uniref:NAD kinase 2, mitochondrial-like isoform X2 n=1 Tax=Aquila chrysaetos chrysaetos TaxID=223781 RepID=UPI001B7D3A88|nr:NAD kinase 2, mitochondrial-like isoform X2 [Aquila chrysaetos chrysaetos]
MSSFRGFFYGYFCFVSRAVARCSPLLCQRAVGASFALPGLPLLGGARRRLLASRGLSPAARCAVVGPGPCVPRRRGCGRLEAAGGGFWPARVAVVVKTTRYEFEQQRYRYAGLSEEDLKQLLALKGSNYAGLLERHRIHTKNMEHVIDSLRSEGHLCLPARYTQSFPEALQKLYRGDFRWQWQQRIRLYLEGTGINPTPVDLHEQQLSQEQHSRAHINERFQDQRSDISGPHLLPVRALNEVFIGESLSSRASYYEISVDDGPWEKQKSSGLNVCTGTGSKAWSYNINKVANQAVEEILKIAKKHGSLNMPLNTELVQKVTNDFNDSLLYSPEEPKMFFSIREPIVNRVLSSSRQRGFSSKVCVRSRCWDACMVVDGGTSFEFNDGAIASIMIDTEDALCTVLLEE